MLEPLGHEIWSAELPLAPLGVRVGTRTTVVRLGGGGLWVHAPGELSPALRESVERLGPVREVVAPNRFHHLFVRQWQDAWPEAHVYAAPGLATKRKSFAFTGDLGSEPLPAWAADVDQTVFDGAPVLGEVLFLHRKSRTLIVTDLLFNITTKRDLWTRLYLTLAGTDRRLAVSRLVRMLVCDRATARASLERVLAWDFDRVLMAHGSPIASGGKDALREAFGYLL